MNRDSPERRRGVRSYVLRQGRLTQAQRRALETLYPRMQVPADPARIDFRQLFGRQAPVWLEIGFGNGVTLADLAQARPDSDFIGAEVHGPGVGHLLLELEARELRNVRVFQGDGVELLRHRIAPASLHGLLILFPDPWHKKRHLKRRLIQAEFGDLVAEKLMPGGLLHLATDWAPYGEHMAEVLSARADFECLLDTTDDDARPAYRRLTRFEARGKRLGHSVRDLIYRRRQSPATDL